jgi:hypothetical protein
MKEPRDPYDPCTLPHALEGGQRCRAGQLYGVSNSQKQEQYHQFTFDSTVDLLNMA